MEVMNMKKKLILLLYILLAVKMISFAQYSEYKNQVKFAPIRIFDILNPGIEFSYQRNYGKFATQISTTYLINLLYPYFRYRNMNGFRLGAEEKFYLPKPQNRKMKLYLSAELAYHYVSYFTEKRFYFANEGPPEDIIFYANWKEFAIQRNSMQINPKFGLEFRHKRFVMEAAAGVGLVYNNVKYQKDENEVIIPNQHFEDILSPIFETDGKYFAPNIIVTFRIGYNF
jgi:hypothetical protein